MTKYSAAPFVALAVVAVVVGGVAAWGLYLRAKLRGGEAKASFWNGLVDKGIGLLQRGASVVAGGV